MTGPVKVNLIEEDRVAVRANGLVVDVIANDDGSVYVECYAYATGEQAVVQHAFIDRYTNPHPSFRLETVLVPMPSRRGHAKA